MDLYQALVSGKSPEELEKLFQSDLKNAQEKLDSERKAAADKRIREAAAQLKKEKEKIKKQEQMKKLKEDLAEQREYVAAEFAEYLLLFVESLLDDDEKEDTENLEKMSQEITQAVEDKLKEFENVFLPLLTVELPFLKNPFSNEQKTEDQIIRDFLNQL